MKYIISFKNNISVYIYYIVFDALYPTITPSKLDAIPTGLIISRFLLKQDKNEDYYAKRSNYKIENL